MLHTLWPNDIKIFAKSILCYFFKSGACHFDYGVILVNFCRKVHIIKIYDYLRITTAIKCFARVIFAVMRLFIAVVGKHFRAWRVIPVYYNSLHVFMR